MMTPCLPEHRTGQPGAPPVVLRFASGASEVRAALARLRAALAPMRMSERDEGKVELVLGEVLNNVVEHAYGAGVAGEIAICCRRRAAELEICVCDAGRAMPGPGLPAGTPPELNCPREHLPEGGFGWFMVRSLTTGLDYVRRDTCNILQFRIPLDDPPE